MNSNRQTKPQAKLYVILSFVLVVISFILVFSSPSQAATFWVTNNHPSGSGSLSQALVNTNLNPGRDFIKFRFSGTIPVTTVLSFDDQSGVVLDGFSAPQPGITLKVNGGTLLVMSSNNVIQGLTIKCSIPFSSWGIQLMGKSGNPIVERNLIEGNRITHFGVAVGVMNQTSKNVIRNNVIVDNRMGVCFHLEISDEAINNNENVIEDNVIGNNTFGIYLGRGFGNVIRGNYIGLNRVGNHLPNGTPFSDGNGIEGGGIVISGNPDPQVPIITANNTVGPGNVIAFNNGPGILIGVSQVTGITITRNSIFENPISGGIILGTTDGSLPPRPEIESTNPIAGKAAPNSTVEIFFDGGDQGRFFIGSVKANASGNFTSAFTLNGILQGNVTATFTDGDGNTSEFAYPFLTP